MTKYTIEVPGRFRTDLAVIDLETKKVPANGFRMRNGEALKNRWSVIMAGIGRNESVTLIDSDGDESYVLRSIAAGLSEIPEIVYGATREFDEMICKGRFTNARRAHEIRPFFPAVPGAESMNWQNVGPAKPGARRGTDVASRDVPHVYATGGPQGWYDVAVHLLRDVAELILVAGEPDEIAVMWCQNVLVSYGFAKAMIDEAQETA